MPDTTTEAMAACDQVQEQAWDYLDDRLTPDASDRVRAHTTLCRRCADYISFQERCRAALRSLHAPRAAPWHVKARILDALIREGYAPR